jgi:hypothetical protein
MTFSEILNLISLNLASGTKIPAAKHREVETAILNYVQANLAQAGDLKMIKSDIAYLQANFETNGLGKNLREGWAICNGNNGTDDFSGRVPLGYGVGYSALNTTGGSKDAVLVAHTHSMLTSNADNGDPGSLFVTAATQQGSAGTTGAASGATPTATDKNLQPYIITLYILKL